MLNMGLNTSKDLIPDSLTSSPSFRAGRMSTTAEVQAIFNNTELPRNKVIFSLLYGAGLRITECLRLRVKDIDFNLGCIQVQDGKGNKQRTTLLPSKLTSSA